MVCVSNGTPADDIQSAGGGDHCDRALLYPRLLGVDHRFSSSTHANANVHRNPNAAADLDTSSSGSDGNLNRRPVGHAD